MLANPLFWFILIPVLPFCVVYYIIQLSENRKQFEHPDGSIHSTPYEYSDAELDKYTDKVVFDKLFK